MNYREKRQYEMLVRVRNFGTAHRHLFPDTSSASAAFAAIAAELPQLEALDVAERVATHASRAVRKASARKRLVEWLVRARNTTRALARTIPQLASHVDLPETMDDRLLVTVARRFESAITPHAEPFAAHRIAIAELGALIEPFEIAVNDRGGGAVRRRRRAPASSRR